MKTSERWCIINAEMNNKRIGVLASALVGCIFTLSAQDLTMKITKRYLNLPVSHQVDRALMTFDVGGRQERVFEIRLASGKPDYWVFCDMSALKNKEIKISYTGNKTGINKIYQADEITGQDSLYKETNRPQIHYTQRRGWNNDPNGLLYYDGEYHLFYQHNPYERDWGNMHWGHAVSNDLIHWEELPIALYPDEHGTVFSGSAVIDYDNTSGFGKNGIPAMVAIYTADNPEKQVQCIAYSLDKGRTWTKYKGNPVIDSKAKWNSKDTRDPKVFWYERTKRWIMVLAVGQEMQIFSSPNLKNWIFESSFGKGQGAHGNVWECPDLFELPVEGTNEKKWVLLCSLGDGPFGDSATQYFVGTFNGKEFVNESPSKTKWMDWGKDHYATVTWSDAPDNRRIAIAWMSNWQYANDVPTSQYRSPNSVPRDLSLFTVDGETYLQSAPSPELLKLRDVSKKRSFKVNGTRIIKDMIAGNEGAYEIELTIENQHADVIGFRLYNDKGEEVDMQYDMKEKKFSMDRRKSGDVGFNENFPMLTWTAIESGKDELKLRLFVDKSSVEAFGDGGRFVMTNQVFPSEPYTHIDFYSKGGAYKVDSFVIYKLKK